MRSLTIAITVVVSAAYHELLRAGFVPCIFNQADARKEEDGPKDTIHCDFLDMSLAASIHEYNAGVNQSTRAEQGQDNAYDALFHYRV